jgi:hypothetical protein
MLARLLAVGAHQMSLDSAAADFLEHFRRVVGEARTLAARKRDVTAVRPALEAVDDVGQAGRWPSVR